MLWKSHYQIESCRFYLRLQDMLLYLFRQEDPVVEGRVLLNL
jgi:hypothetical protein